jgi:hypothetical protein
MSNDLQNLLKYRCLPRLLDLDPGNATTLILLHQRPGDKHLFDEYGDDSASNSPDLRFREKLHGKVTLLAGNW